MSWEAIAKIGELGLVVAQCVFFAFMFFMKGTFATKKDVGGALEVAADAQHRIDLMAERMKNMPTHDTIEDVRGSIGDLKIGQAESKTKLDAMDENVKRIVRTMDRVEDFVRTVK